jgi:hypothetical protein
VKPVLVDFLERIGGCSDTLPDPSERRFWLALLRAFEPLRSGEPYYGGPGEAERLHRSRTLAVYLESALRAEEILLTGYDEERPEDPEGFRAAGGEGEEA